MHDQLDQAYCTFHICNPIPFTYEPVEAFRIIQFQTVATESPLLPIYAASSRVKTQSVLTKTLLTAVSDKPVAETICPGYASAIVHQACSAVIVECFIWIQPNDYYSAT
jgi:hypothetical protein